MATEVKVPSTGNAGEPAVVLDWSVAVGQAVSAGDVVATLETAKAVVEVDAPVDGIVLDIRFESGDEAPEFDVLLVIGDAAEAVQPTAPVDAAPAPEEKPAEASREAVAGGPSSPSADAAPTQRRRISISPRARRLALGAGVEIDSLEGSGPFGRILFSDVEAAAADVVAAAAPQTAAEPVGPPASEGRHVRVRGARRATAQRMHASLQQAAQVTLTRYAPADALLAYAARLRAGAESRDVQRIGVNDLLMFATARTVARHPAANAWFDWETITEFDQVHLGFAVDTDRALLVPVIRDAHALSLAELARQAHAAIERARSSRTSPAELEGGTFTISNLGGSGIHWFTPVLNTPQMCILGVGAVHRAVADAPAQIPLSLTFDHRGIDGSAAASLLKDLAEAIEHVDTLAAY